ncbi:uncharacterized protein TNCV_1447911 [Trichonephila clavipes]|nr:uncharacterized protein TNCV_1447911 [Trichonephila clavipes]
MSFLGKKGKADLIKLAIELGECESNGEELKIIELRTKLLTNDAYEEDPEFVKCIVSNRIDEENKQKEQTLREFDLQKIRLQNETQRVVGPQTLPQTKIELKNCYQHSILKLITLTCSSPYSNGCSNISTWRTCLCSITSAEQRCARKKCKTNATLRRSLRDFNTKIPIILRDC